MLAMALALASSPHLTKNVLPTAKQPLDVLDGQDIRQQGHVTAQHQLHAWELHLSGTLE